MKSRIASVQQDKTGTERVRYDYIVMSNGDTYKNAIDVDKVAGKDATINGWLMVEVNNQIVALNADHIASVHYKLPQGCEGLIE